MRLPVHRQPRLIAARAEGIGGPEQPGRRRRIGLGGGQAFERIGYGQLRAELVGQRERPVGILGGPVRIALRKRHAGPHRQGVERVPAHRLVDRDVGPPARIGQLSARQREYREAPDHHLRHRMVAGDLVPGVFVGGTRPRVGAGERGEARGQSSVQRIHAAELVGHPGAVRGGSLCSLRIAKAGKRFGAVEGAAQVPDEVASLPGLGADRLQLRYRVSDVPGDLLGPRDRPAAGT